MADTKKSKKWTSKKEKEDLLNAMHESRAKKEGLEAQKKILYDSIENVLEDENLTDEQATKKLEFLRSQISDIKEQINDEVRNYNNFVERYSKLEESGTGKERNFWTAVEVVGGIVLGGAGLVWAHRDNLNGRIKNKEEDNFFQAAWKKLFR